MAYTYRDLHFYEWMLSELKKMPGSKPEHIETRIVEIKRKLRADNKIVDDRKVVKDYGIDGAIVLFPLPGDIQSRDEADEYFREYEYIHYRPSAYDCTGQLFTSWYKIVRRNGKFWAYHSVARDV